MQYSEGSTIDGRYVLTALLGRGSFGEVWLAKDSQTDLEVAIKIYIALDEQGLEDFRKEFQLSFNLNHTNLLHANYLGVNEDDRPFLVMTYCRNGSVSRNAGDMEEKDIWRFIRDTASGLDYLHTQDPPIIHQDIKPDNILMLNNGTYVITDFGISKQLRRSMRKSANSSSAGAVSYMGPERFSKHYQAVKASDIWSLGAAIYELAVGDLPFCGMGGSLQKQGADIPDLPDSFSPELNDVVAACLAMETWDRPTAHQLYDYAQKHLDGEESHPAWLQRPAAAEPEAPAPAPAPAPASPAPAQPRTPQPSSAFRGTIPSGTTSYQAKAPVYQSSYNTEKLSVTSKADALLWVLIPVLGLILGALAKFLIG